MKSYTDIEQSKKLAEILPLESADMIYPSDFDFPFVWIENPEKDKNAIPCWSLASLLGVLPEGTRLLKSANILSVGDTKYHCDCPKANIDKWFDNPVDACVDMIEKLNELNLL